jgi:hypothetical protein
MNVDDTLILPYCELSTSETVAERAIIQAKNAGSTCPLA